jgi:hypothetical protein
VELIGLTILGLAMIGLLTVLYLAGLVLLALHKRLKALNQPPILKE